MENNLSMKAVIIERIIVLILGKSIESQVK